MFDDKLYRSRSGGGILFCGAGFSADCLNFSEKSEIGTGSNLLEFLNNKLASASEKYGYKKLQNAADEAKRAFGEHGLMALLRERYTIENVSSDMVTICKFPWERIYTTNDDNSIELSLQKAKEIAQPLNNLDDPNDLEDTRSNIVYLHGRAESWTIRNFNQSCILGADSYHRTDEIHGWLDLFRRDLDRSEIVVFVGFNAEDFHLNEVLRDTEGLREKIFFINRSSSEPDVDVESNQKRFGTPLYIGRQSFSEKIIQILNKSKPVEPHLSSFERYKRVEPALTIPSTREIEDLFIFGEINESQMARDIDNGISEYFVQRDIVDQVITDIESGVNNLLLTGEICDGKTIIVKSITRRLDKVRPVFLLKIPYDDILEEVSQILEIYSNAVLMIENCFEINRHRLISLLRQFDGSDGALFLTSRSIAAEANTSEMKTFRNLNSFREYSARGLSTEEVISLSSLIDQFGGWSEFRGQSLESRERYILQTCRSSFPGFLLELLKSNYVRDRYLEEYNKIDELKERERSALIAALYISHIGERLQVSLLSDIFDLNAGGLLRRLESAPNGLRLLRLRGSLVETAPSIGATTVLKRIVPDKIIVNAVTDTLRSVSQTHEKYDWRRYIVGQMMRYSIISPLIQDESEVTRFFDNISKIKSIRRKILFWLQWSIALRHQKEYDTAEKRLQQAYREAESFEKRNGRPFETTQLDDVKAKLIISKSMNRDTRSGDLYNNIRTATEIVAKLLRREDLTHHPFQTVNDVVDLFVEKRGIMDNSLESLSGDLIVQLLRLARQRSAFLPAGYQFTIGSRSLDEAVSRLHNTGLKI